MFKANNEYAKLNKVVVLIKISIFVFKANNDYTKLNKIVVVIKISEV